MPDWCGVQMRVTGPEEDLAEFASKIEESREWNGEGCVHLLAAILPMPDQLKGICTGHAIIDGKRYERWYEASEDAPEHGISSADEQDLLGLYGAADPATWRRAHWGPDYGVDAWTRMGATHNGALQFQFEAVHGLPLDMLALISQHWPTLRFEVQYRIEGDQREPIVLSAGRELKAGPDGKFDDRHLPSPAINDQAPPSGTFSLEPGYLADEYGSIPDWRREHYLMGHARHTLLPVLVGWLDHSLRQIERTG